MNGRINAALVPCTHCDKSFSSRGIQSHMRLQHGIRAHNPQNQDLTPDNTQPYVDFGFVDLCSQIETYVAFMLGYCIQIMMFTVVYIALCDQPTQIASQVGYVMRSYKLQEQDTDQEFKNWLYPLNSAGSWTTVIANFVDNDKDFEDIVCGAAVAQGFDPSLGATQSKEEPTSHLKELWGAYSCRQYEPPNVLERRLLSKYSYCESMQSIILQLRFDCTNNSTLEACQTLQGKPDEQEWSMMLYDKSDMCSQDEDENGV